MNETKDRYGHAMTMDRTKAVCLWWYSAAIPDDGKVKFAALPDPDGARGRSGIYVFEGSHDSRPGGGVLYVGKSEASAGLGARAKDSWEKFSWHEGRGHAREDGLFADVWRMTFRWAAVEEAWVEDVEALLIRAHAPSFNAQGVRAPLVTNTAKDLLVLNSGAKGMLLPAVSGKYFDTAFWKELGD